MKIQKKGFWNFISIIVFIVCFIGIYMCLDTVFMRKDAYIKNGEFIKEENNFDVLFFGNSHAFDAIYPMELWKQYGIFSYNLAGPNNEIAVSYWTLVNALDYKEPKLVVLDCTAISKDSKVPIKNMNNIHKTLDVFPFSANKIKGISDLMEKKEGIGFLWKFSLYHSRWNELQEEDFSWEYASDKGAELHVNVAVPREKAYVPRTEKIPADTVGVEYLKKTIELCKERDIDILLTYLPFPAKETQVKEANLVYDIAEVYNVNYINFLDMDEIVDFDTDCYDFHSHMNPSGARKITEYMGAYIQETYGIADRREDPFYTSWYEDYNTYTAHKLDLISEQQNLDAALMLHYDKNVSTCIYVKGGSGILQDERMVKLIKNVSPYAELEKIEIVIQKGSDYFLVVDNGWGDIWECVEGEELENLNTTFGNLVYSPQKEGNPVLYIQDSENSYLGDYSKKEELPDVQIITINRLTGEIVNQSSYMADGYDEHGNIVGRKIN